MLNKRRKMQDKRAVNKKAVSLMISYVLLIVIGLGIAGMVYGWVKFRATVPEQIGCPENTALIIKRYSCENNIINVTFQNKGLFSLDGFYIRASTKENVTPTLPLTPTKGKHLFSSRLIPNAETSASFDYSDIGLIKSIQIQPIMIDQKTEVTQLCENMITMKIDACVAEESVEAPPADDGEDEAPPEEEPECLDTCSSLGYDCGTHIICGVSENCPACSSGGVCNPLGQCKLTSGLISYWSFNANSATDDSVNSNNGNPSAGISFLPGKIGQAASFNGAGYISVPGNSFRTLSTGTITGWFKTSTSGVITATLTNRGSNRQFPIQPTSKGIAVTGVQKVVGGVIGTVICETNIASKLDNNWHHFAYTTTSGSNNFLVYIDGTNTPYTCTGTKTDIFYNDVMDSTDNLQIGAKSDSGNLHTGYFNGLIDELRIYNRVLTQDEITLLAEQTE